MGNFHPDSRLMQILTALASFLALNVVFVLSAAPLVTAGPALVALYTVTRKMARREDPSILSSFYRAFRENFHRALLCSLVLLLPTLLLVCYLFFGIYGTLDAIPGMRIWCIISVGILGVVCSYVPPLLAWWDNPIPVALRGAFLLPLGQLPVALFVTALNLLPLFWLLRSPDNFVRVSFLWLSVGFSMTAFLNTQLLRLSLRRYLPDDEFAQSPLQPVLQRADASKH